MMRFWLFAFLLLCNVNGTISANTEPQQAHIIQINGIISPATEDYFSRSLEKAVSANAAFLLIRLDTPGGLDASMREMIKQIISSPIPVVTYVTPSGARAASAGTYLLYASHIAAMSPATNLGAATPVQFVPAFSPDDDKDKTADKPKTDKNDDAMTRKIVNDAVAYIRGLAELRGRNADWAEKAVKEAVSLTADAALEQNVIDIVATDQQDLVQQLNGQKVNVLGSELTLNTQAITLTEILPDWRNKILAVITNPSIAYILMMIGIYGLIFEFANPGSIVPGTVGSICLLIALFSFQVLPINYAGLALMLLGIGLMVAEAFQPSFGILGLGGVAAFVAGSVMLIDTELPGYGINIGVVAGITVSTVTFLLIALTMVIRNRHDPVVSGREQMLGLQCVALEDFSNVGRVEAHGEHWRARTDRPIHKGEKARVTGMSGLTLRIVPISEQEESS
jgi:membrane-bound serine protease (ClpP class)